MTAINDSVDPFDDPGKLIISDLSRLPATALDNIAWGVILSDSTIIAMTIPFASFSRICFVASGVLSRDENPVPPVVNIKS